MDRNDYTLDDAVTYLNNGSFGPSPRRVQDVRKVWIDRLERQPMQFLTRDLEPALIEAMASLAHLVGTNHSNMAFVDNATFGMNAVASTVPLDENDEVLLTDHEYGAVMRIWRDRCKQTGANVVVQRLPDPLTSPAEMVEKFWEGVTPKTKLIVISHVTSATAAIFPVKEVCQRARQMKIPVCIDGPHAIGMIPVNLDDIDCDFYCASCHKWLSAPFGTGFLYVAPRWQHRVKPTMISWGGSVSGQKPSWQDEFNWVGTRDLSGFLSVPEAIRCLEEHGLERFRSDTHKLAWEGAERIASLTGLSPLIADHETWNGSMITLPIPGEIESGQQHGRRDPLQVSLWEKYRIEIPVFTWKQQRFIRISCHLYNTEEDIDRLETALKELL